MIAALCSIAAWLFVLAIGCHYCVRPLPLSRLTMRPRFLRLLLLSLFLASPLAAQGTGADSAHWKATKIDLDSIARDKTAPLYSKRAVARIRTRDSLRTIAVKPPTPPKDTTVVVVPPVTPPDTTTPPVQPPPTTPGAMVGPAKVAALPLAEPVAPYPTPTRVVRVASGASLQNAISAYQCGDEIRLAMRGVWKEAPTIPAKPCASGWLVIRADTTDAALAGRMTPSKAAALGLPRIETPSSAGPITVAFAANHIILDGLDLTTGPTAPVVNVLVKFGDGASNGMTTRALVPHDLVLRHSFVHGTPTLETKRCVLVNSSETDISDNWFEDCHSHNNDAQCIAGYNGTRTVRIQNNRCDASHEVIVFGGDTPGDSSMGARDITVRGNHITRPAAWKGQWPVKNLIETKYVRRLLIEGNVIENNWSDAQVGYALLFKSENQNNDSPWTTSSDITVRGNLIRNTGACFNLSGTGSNGAPVVRAARITIEHNACLNVNVAPYTASSYTLQFLNGAEDVILAHNTFGNATALGAVNFDAVGAVRLAMHSNAIYAGQYAVKGAACNGGQCLSLYAPGALFANNLILGAGTYPLSCSYGATNSCPAALPASLPLGYDSQPIGADPAVLALPARVVVAP